MNKLTSMLCLMIGSQVAPSGNPNHARMHKIQEVGFLYCSVLYSVYTTLKTFRRYDAA